MSKLFRTKREDFGKSISEVAAITRIKESCLVAIEEEDYDKLPIEVYARGYIKEYAKYLSLPVEDGLSPYEIYLEMKKGPKEKKSPTPSPDNQSGTPQKIREELWEPAADEAFCKEAKVRTAPSGAINKAEAAKIYGNKFLWKGILLLVVVLAVVYQFFSTRNAEQESRVVPMTQQVQPPREVSPNEVTPQPAPALPATGEMKPPGIVPGKKRHELVISAEDTSWVQVIMDGSEKKESLLKRGESLTAEADNTISVVVGNAGGVSLRFDGKDLPPGKKGEVLRLTLPEKPKAERPAGDIALPAPNKPSTSVKPEPAPKKISDEKAVPKPLPEQPASTSKP